MSIRRQVRNFLRVLVKGAPGAVSASGADALATTAGHLRHVNMSVEDERLADPARNEAYKRSLGQ